MLGPRCLGLCSGGKKAAEKKYIFHIVGGRSKSNFLFRLGFRRSISRSILVKQTIIASISHQEFFQRVSWVVGIMEVPID